MILTNDRRVVGTAAGFEAGALAPLDSLESELLSQAAGVLGIGAMRHEGPVRFEVAGDAWWGEVRPFALSNSQVLSVAVVAAESDPLSDVVYWRFVVGLVTLAALAVALWRAVALARYTCRPIEALVAETDRISRGDLDRPMAMTPSVGEMQQLAQAQEHMRTSLQALMKLERDLQVARQIQQKAFPQRLPTLPGWLIHAWSEPADETGGDVYDVIGLKRVDGRWTTSEREAERAVMLLADATGHGIGPALVATEVRAMLRMALRSGQSLASLMTHMNEQLCIDLDEGRFVTA